MWFPKRNSLNKPLQTTCITNLSYLTFYRSVQSALAQLKTQEIISGSSNGDVAASNTASTTPTGLAQETGSNNGDVAASNTAPTTGFA